MRPRSEAARSPKLRSLSGGLTAGVARRGMTSVRGFLGAGWAWPDSPLRRGIAVGVLLALTAAAAAVGLSGLRTGAANDSRPGRPVPPGQVQAISTAALSCSVLTPARLAGQLMVASGFDPNARTEQGGTGVAGLTDAVWDEWKPAADARREDSAASVVALAHYMCDLSGRVRQARTGGDQWRLALAAYHSGVAAVRDAGGVPGAAKRYVDMVTGYATWYARQPEFSGSGATSSAGPLGGVQPSAGTPAKPVPDAYLSAILLAGKACPAVPATRVAAQLMAASGFNPNLLGANGGQGIAQFDPVVWAEYAPDAAVTSPWDPQRAITALGVVMCALVEELGPGEGDAYQKALAAFRWGPETVRRAGGVPDAPAVRVFVALAEGYVTSYQGDPRLPGPRPSPSTGGPDRSLAGSGGRTPGAGPAGDTATGGVSGAQTGGQPAPAQTPAKPASTRPQPKPVGSAGPIIGHGSGRCVDVTDGAYRSNPQLQIWDCNGGPNQRWTVYSDGTIRAFDRCMTVAGGSTANGAWILLSVCDGSASQQFTLNKAHDLVNKRADRCVDARYLGTSNGTRLQLWDCAGTDNQKWHR
ncbi:ricin-type beta-trefoil lectin domain protein [Micromonospora sp. NPDC003197]